MMMIWKNRLVAAAATAWMRSSARKSIAVFRMKPLLARDCSTRKFSTIRENDGGGAGAGAGGDLASPNEFATNYHAPVMWKECIQALLGCQRAVARTQGNNNKRNEPLIFIDGTLGGGGHSAALLQQLSPGDIVLGCDVDPMALSTASERLHEYLAESCCIQKHEAETNHQQMTCPLFVPIQSNFANLVKTLSDTLHPITKQPIAQNGVDGILLDLGVSSHQIDTADRGFAFLKEGPLDMRLGGGGGDGSETYAAGLTAADICNEFDEQELRRILKTYGDEPRAKAIAHAIVEQRPLHSTVDLMKVVASVTPEFAKKGRRMGRTATLARVFQSLRIVVNQEDIVLEKALTEMAPKLLRPGGRLVVLSYHSLEDRATKRVMRDGSVSQKVRNERDIYGNYIGTPRPFRTLGKPQKATDEEVQQNSRARSATLRVAERQDT